MKYSKPVLLCLLFLLGLGFITSMPSTESITYNGVTISSNGSGADQIAIVTSPSHYEWRMRKGGQWDNNRMWNLSRLDVTPSEQTLTLLRFAMIMNGTTQSSQSNDVTITWTNSTFTDSLGSGILFNRTMTTPWLGGSLYGVKTFDIWRFYPTFITEEITLRNDYDNKVRDVGYPMFWQATGYNLKVGSATTTRYSECGVNGLDRPASTLGYGQTPAFI